MTNLNILPIRLIRIARDSSLADMAEIFDVTRAYMSAIEKGIRTMESRRLELGLIKMGIPYESYRELTSFCELLDKEPLSHKDQFKFGLIKAIGTISPDLKEQSEQLIEQALPLKGVKKIPITTYQYLKVQ